MRILHIDFTSPYNEEMSYQENLLPKYHAKDGHEVIMLTTCLKWNNEGEICHVDPVDKVIDNGVRLIRKDYHKIVNRFLTNKIRKVDGVYQFLTKISPNIIFFHSPQSIELLTVAEYIRRSPKTILYVDNHADFSNSASNSLSLNILHKIFYRYIISKAEPYVIRFYGVLPARVDFLTDIYKIPKEKCDLLVMGADNDIVLSVKKENEREKIRSRFSFTEDDFVIITGGKIDSAKKQVVQLLQAMQLLRYAKIKLLIFGSIEKDLVKSILSYVDNQRIRYLGWISPNDIYGYFVASDLAVFPGRHSVLWEQAVGSGIPCIFKFWEGTTHVDVGGNCRFLYDDNMEEIKDNLEEIYKNRDIYRQMKSIAVEIGLKTFSYKEISRKAIQISTRD